MKKGEAVYNEIQHVFEQKPLLVATETVKTLRTTKYLKRLICIAGLGVMLFSNACFVGKPTREASFIPEENNVRKQHKRRVFIAGHWVKTSKGRRWVRGHWERR
jgi:hypothetical protein